MKRLTLAATSAAVFFGFSPADAAPKLSVTGVAGSFKPGSDSERGFSDRIEIKGSRGEVVNFVLKIRGLEKCEILAASATHGLSLRFLRIETIDIKKRSFPSARLGKHADPLLPIDDKKICGSWKVADGSVWVWGELQIEKSAAPGDRSIRVDVGGKKVASLEARVWKMTMPDQPGFRLYSEYAPYGGVIGHYGKWSPQEGGLAGKYIDVMLEHGIAPLNAWLKVPPVKVLKSARNGFAMDLAYSENKGESFEQLLLKRLPPWAWVQYPGRMDLVKDADRQRHFAGVETSINEKKLSGRALVYLADEPKDTEMQKLIDAAKTVRKEAPNLKIMVTTPYQAKLKGLVDAFAIPMNYADTRATVPEGASLWWYVSCMSHGCDGEEDPGVPDLVIERPSSYVRSIGWLAEKYGVRDFLYFQVNYAYQFYPSRDTWKDQWDFTGNGDGTLLYPGRAGEHGLKSHLPITSVRLKILRESKFDYQYLAWMRGVDRSSAPWWNEVEKSRKAVAVFERDSRAYQALRDRIGDYLNAREVSK